MFRSLINRPPQLQKMGPSQQNRTSFHISYDRQKKICAQNSAQKKIDKRNIDKYMQNHDLHKYYYDQLKINLFGPQDPHKIEKHTNSHGYLINIIAAAHFGHHNALKSINYWCEAITGIITKLLFAEISNAQQISK